MSDSSVWLGTVGLGREFGGVAHVARCCVDALRERGHDSGVRLDHVISLLDGADMQIWRESTGASIQGCRGNRIRFTSGVMAQFMSPPDLVVYDHVDIAQCQTLLPRWRRAPYMVWVHGIEVWKELPKRKLAALRQAEQLIFNSDFTRRRFESFHGDQFRSVVVPLTAGATSTASRPPSESRQPWLLTVGRMEPDRPKGHQQILEAMPEIVAAVPEVEWHVVGKGKNLEPFRQRVEASGFADRIRLHGFLEMDAMQRLFQQCRVFAMPSFGEGFGIVYVEAMAAGCVPVGSTLDAAPEVIGDGGICVDLDEQGNLADRLVLLLNESDGDFERRSAAAVARAEHFSPDRFSKNFLAALLGPR